MFRSICSLALPFFSVSSLLADPTASELIPSSAPRGARVVIAGSELDASSLMVSFLTTTGTIRATIISRSSALIEFVVPSNAISSNVVVSVGDKTIATFPFTASPDPPFTKVATLIASDKAHDVLKQPAAAAMTTDGKTWVADRMHHQVKVIGADGSVIAVIGTGKPGQTDGPASQAQFKEPQGIAIDSNRALVFVADSGNNAIRKIAPDGSVTTFAAGFKNPSGLAVASDGTLMVADSGNDAIRKIAADGSVTTFASGFKNPVGVAIASDGTLFVADSGNNRIRKIENGIVETIAGTGHDGFVDGANAEFKKPSGITLDDAGNILVADSGNNAIRKISSSLTSTISGSSKEGFIDGDPVLAQFKQPSGVDFQGVLLVAD